MINADPVPPVSNDEMLSRFVLHSNEFRRSDNTVRPKLFLPYTRTDLSVNRHRDSNEQEIWDIGRKVAADRRLTLYGRTEIEAARCRIKPLDVLAKPLPGNPNHADITGFPTAKEDQISYAQKLAAAAGKRIEAPIEKDLSGDGTR